MIKKEEIEELKKDIKERMEIAKNFTGSMNDGVEGWLAEYLHDLGYRKKENKHLINYNKFPIKILQTMYRTKDENCTRLYTKYKIAESFYQEELVELNAIEKALKKKGVLPNQIDIEEITENP